MDCNLITLAFFLEFLLLILEKLLKIGVFTLTLTSSSLGYFFDSCPWGFQNLSQRRFSVTLIRLAAFSMNICREAKCQIFSSGGVELRIGLRMRTLRSRHFSLVNIPRDFACRKTPLGQIFTRAY